MTETTEETLARVRREFAESQARHARTGGPPPIAVFAGYGTAIGILTAKLEAERRAALEQATNDGEPAAGGIGDPLELDTP